MHRGVLAIVLVCAAATIRCAAQTTFYPVPSGNSGLYGIAAGADGTIWFTEQNTTKIGRLTPGAAIKEFIVPPPANGAANLGDITSGSDGAMWFGEIADIGRIDTAGNVTHFFTGGGPPGGTSMTAGPNGTIWSSQGYGSLDGIDTSGKLVAGFTVGLDSSIGNFAFAPDGSLWAIVSGQPRDTTNLRHITTAGNIIKEFTVTPGPGAIAAGADGAMWFTAAPGNIGRIDANGAITLFPTPTANSGPHDIRSGPDGALWFTEAQANQIGRITTGGTFTEYPLPPIPAGANCTAATGGPNRLTIAPDGSIWFTEPCLNQIGRLSFGGPGTLATGAINPAQGIGTSGTFAFTFSDSAGWQNLGVLNVLINNALDGRKACYLAYSVSSGTLVLVDDAGDAGGPYAGSLSLGSTGTIQNRQCSASLISAAGSGDNLTLTLGVDFSAGLSGNLIQYVAARDNAQNNSGWQASGVWNSPILIPSGPISVSALNPARTGVATSQSMTLTFTAADNKGLADMGVVNLLVNNFIDGRQACYLAYVPATNALFLVDDAGDAGGPFAGSMAMNGGSSVIQNSQCAVSGQGSSAVSSGNQLALTLQISFLMPLAGNRIFWVAARDVAGANNTGWQALGTALIVPNP